VTFHAAITDIQLGLRIAQANADQCHAYGRKDEAENYEQQIRERMDALAILEKASQ